MQSVHQIIQAVSYVGEIRNKDRKIEYEHQQKDHNSQPGCRQTCFFIADQAQSCNHKDRTRRVAPKRVSWNPERRQLLERNSGRQFRMQKLLYAKERDGHSNEEPCKRNEPFA